MKVQAKAYAKINLTLEITGKRDDGYHLLRSVMQSVGLHDTVTVEATGTPGIAVECRGEYSLPLPQDRDNIAYQACERFFRDTGISPGGIHILIDKRIPVMAGLGGGSADAAAVLLCLNRLLAAELPLSRLCAIGGKIGADVPFCLTGGTALATDIGDRLEPLPPMPDAYIVIAQPEERSSTKEAYALLDRLGGTASGGFSEKAAQALPTEDIERLAECLFNDFERVILREPTGRIKQVMQQNGALNALLSGSGSAVFGLFREDSGALRCAAELRESCGFAQVTRPVRHGPQPV